MTRRQLRSASFAAFALISLGAYGCTEGPGSTITITPGSSGDPTTTTTGAGGADGSSSTGAAPETTVTTATTGAGAGTTTSTGASSTTTTTGVTTTTTTTGTGGPPPGSFELALVDSSPSSDLMDDATLDLTLTPEMGFTGTVNLAATVPSGVTAEFDDPSPTITGAAVTAHLTLHVDSTVGVGDTAFTVTATSAAIDRTADGTLTVNPSITLHIPQNVLTMGTPTQPYKTAYGPYPIVIQSNGNPITVRFMNDDSISHEIHSGGTFGHDPGNIPPHQMDPDVRQVGGGQYDWYLHDQGSAATPGQMIVQ